MITQPNLRLLIAINLTMIACFLSGSASPAPEPIPPPDPTPTPMPPPPTSTSEPFGLLPDLTITDVRVEPMPVVIAGRSTIVRGTTYSFTFEVSNVGEGSIPGAAVSIDYGCQGPGMGKIGPWVVARGPIGPGESKLTEPPYTFVIPADRMPGTCGFAFMVDPDNIYEESDESPASNIWEMTLGVN